jgi:hypothetical protein
MGQNRLLYTTGEADNRTESGGRQARMAGYRLLSWATALNIRFFVFFGGEAFSKRTLIVLLTMSAAAKGKQRL